MNGSINTAENDTSPLLTPIDAQAVRQPSPRSNIERRVSADVGRVIRSPVAYNSINSSSASLSNSHESAVISRYKYYNRLAPHSESTFTMPDHVVPSMFLITNVVKSEGSQSSWITIFSLWNTMMGTSLLSMPWAIKQAGFVTGISLLVGMAGIMLYTSYRILTSVQGIKSSSGVLEFTDVCRAYLGRWAELLAFVSSLLTLLGGMIVYWILISNFLYNIVTFIYHKVEHDEPSSSDSTAAYCPTKTNSSFPSPHNGSSLTASDPIDDSTFTKIWDEQKTVPFILIAVIGPLINLKSPTFFTKFNALGTISVTYLVCFVGKNVASWGIHMDFSNVASPSYAPEFEQTFPALTGVAALAYFVQNCVLSITRTQKHPENNVRDLVIAYILVAMTYVYMGVMFYISFDQDKSCIQDNFLENLKDTNVMAFVARIGLFFQMLCVFPLLVYIFRLQFMTSLFGSVWPSWKHVGCLNIVLVAVCVVFAVFLPHIGKIIGFVGAFCGFTYAIMLPCLVYMKIRHNSNTLSPLIIVVHSILIVIGLANFIGQFVILGESS